MVYVFAAKPSLGGFGNHIAYANTTIYIYISDILVYSLFSIFVFLPCRRKISYLCFQIGVLYIIIV